MSDSSLTQVDERTLEDYRHAMSGCGPLAYTWSDKPHRLVYDLIKLVEGERSRLVEVERERDEAKGINAFDIGVANAELAEDLKAAEARAEGYREALVALNRAAHPYVQDAAPHEQLFSGEDLRNYERLAAAKQAAVAALRPSSGESPQ